MQFICYEFPLVPMSILVPRGFEDQFPVVSGGKTGPQQFVSRQKLVARLFAVDSLLHCITCRPTL